MFHGFGASSLSWLPVLPKITDRLRVQRTLAHDSVGFGFTDRPKDVNMYTPLASSDIAISMLNTKVQNNCSSVIIMGHSMGSFAALETAARLPEDVAVTVVLVAPALGLSSRVAKGSVTANAVNGLTDIIFSILVSPILRLLLRRLVGVDGFWKRGTSVCFGETRRWYLKVMPCDLRGLQLEKVGKKVCCVSPER
jgi:pimeloyl-ACP methyl ester carboxylesterase